MSCLLPRSRRRVWPIACALLAALAASISAHAEQQPLWELGLGPAMLVLRDYRGASSSHAYPLPLLYFVYRGKFLRSDREGVRGRIFDQKFLELHISLSATPPVRNAAARSGMPGLRSTIEIGPELDMRLWRSAQERVKVDFLAAARSAITLQAKPQDIGWILDPHLALDLESPAGLTGWKLGLLTGPLFATRRYNDYFYTVAPQYATAQRPAYQAPGGFSGTQLVMSLSKRFPRYWTGGYVRYDTLSGASFAASPLVKRNGYWSAGFAIAWMIGRSGRLVEATD
jgi:MipA family protein